MTQRQFLFLQGPISPFFSEIARGLAARGHGIHGIQFNFGDRLFWRHPGAVRYRGSLADWPAFIRDFYMTRGITDIVLLGEQREYHRKAIELAQQRGIRVTVTDFGYLRPDWIVLEKDGMSGNSHFPRTPEAIRALAAQCPRADLTPIYRDSFWTMALWDMAYHLGNYFLGWLFPRFHNHKLENPVLVYLGTGLRLLFAQRNTRRAVASLQGLMDGGAPYFVYPLQMANDFQLRAYSDFGDQGEAIVQVIRSFADHAPTDAHLLAKVHPWDPGLVNWRRQVDTAAREAGVADRVHYVDGGSLDDMSRHARGMVTINSTSGLKALTLGCPVITLGQAIFDVPGLTFQDGLDRFWNEAAPPEAALLDDYLAAMTGTLLIRGVFYNRPGLDAGVAEAVRRLDEGLINALPPERRLP
ncbi:MAG: capsular biosynthesis protein [Pseudomonadota bacterium]